MNAQYYIYNTKTNSQINIQQLSSELSPFNIIMFGEFHDDSTIHYIQYELFKQLFQNNKQLTLSMEMFETDIQPILNNYLSNKINKEEFLKNSRPWGDYKEFYEPMVEFAKSNNLNVIAANVPRKYAAMYITDGFSGIKKLPQTELNYITKSLTLDQDEYMDRFFENMLSDKNKIKELEPNEENTLYLYYGSQLVKDETMAQSIVESYNKNPENKIYHLNGDFHSKYHLGTTQKILDRNNKLKIAVITPLYYTKSDEIKIPDNASKMGDFIIFVPEKQKEKMMMPTQSMNHFGKNFVIEHNLTIDIEPTTSTLKGNDTIKFKNPIIRRASVDILKDLNVEKIEFLQPNISYTIVPLNDNFNRIIFQNNTLNNKNYGTNGIDEMFEAIIHYKGKIYYKPNETSLIQRHSNSLGIISPNENEGIYLPGSAYYPKTDLDLADFKATISIPEEYTLVTSFIKDITYSAPIREKKLKYYNISSDFAIDDLTLVGGKYKKVTDSIEGRIINIYTYQDFAEATPYINSIKKYYTYYTNLFGKYPFKEFSVVENFFATGFGMPGYTLLSGRLMKMPWVVLSPGSIAHEFVHNWWGNSVFTDYEKGNWCEGLTTFSTNYYYNELINSTNESLNWRKKALIEMDALPKEKNYPVKEFKYQSNIFDATIGYQKSAFIFIEIMKLMGKEPFFESLRNFANKYTGKRAYWFNIASEFDLQAKNNKINYPIRKIFNQWIANNNLPEIKLKNHIQYLDSIEIILNIKNPIQSKLAIKTIGKDTNKVFYDIKDTTQSIKFKLNSDVTEVQIDPDYESLRKLYQWEKPFSLNRTLNDKPIIIIPEKQSPDYPVIQKFIEEMKQSGYNFKVYHNSEANIDVIKNQSVILIGNIKNNKDIFNQKKNLEKLFQIDNKDITVKKKSYKLDSTVALINIDHPVSNDKLCSIFYIDGNPNEKMMTRFFHYLSYSVVVLNNSSRSPILQEEIFPAITDKQEMRIKISK